MISKILILASCVSAFCVTRDDRQKRVVGPRATAIDAETTLLRVLGDGRVSLSSSEEALVAQCLAALPASTATVEALDGTWRLLYTSKSNFDAKNPLGRRVDGTAPGIEGLFAAAFGDDDDDDDSRRSSSSSSPIQRALTSIELVRIEQVIDLAGPAPRVDQLVAVNEDLGLRLSAAASFDETSGRIDFTFDQAYFTVFGARVPYPVPFRLLGDEAKGWLDTSFVSQNLRVSRGNKGTTFILSRPPYSSPLGGKGVGVGVGDDPPSSA